MGSRLALVAIVAAGFACAGPASALQTVTLPQPGDNTPTTQNPNNPAQDQWSTDQSDSKADPFGSFHFNVTSGSDWPGDSYRMYRPQNSSPDAYGGASTPGSEFSNSYLFPH